MSADNLRIVPVYACPVGWDNLKPTQADGVRWCDHCAQSVYHVTDANGLRAAVAEGHCVKSDAPGLVYFGNVQLEPYSPMKPPPLEWD